jgi:dipeptidyl aminopeptidase/acylaminoacyl peptidase
LRDGRIDPVWLAGAVAFIDYALARPVLTVVETADGRTRFSRAVGELLESAEAEAGPMGLRALAGDLLLVAGSNRRLVSPIDGAARALGEDELAALARSAPRITVPGYPTIFPPEMEVASPDGAWFLTVQDHDLWLRPAGEGEARRLTDDGLADPRWSTANAAWSADGRRIALMRVDERQVYRVPLVDWTGEARNIVWHVFPRADGAIPVSRAHLIDVASGAITLIGGGDEDHYAFIQGFSVDSGTLRYSRLDRRSRRVEVLAYDIAAGRTRTLLEETSKTFLYWTPTFFRGGSPIRFLKDGRFLWQTEASGWNQIHLHDADGRPVRPLTAAGYPVTDIAGVDEAQGVVFYRAQPDPERPYDIQLFRVGLDGGAPTRLSAAAGMHELRLSPDATGYVGIHSAPDRPPQAELHDAGGKRMTGLSTAEATELKALGWIPPEVFRVKAADGATDLYGALHKPYDFDPARRYPVIEFIYAGGQTIHTPWSFGGWASAAFAQLGYIVITLDGRGTPGRGKAFQDMVVGALGDYEIADHAGAIRQLAADRPYMDLARVGIFGGSYGGYFSVRALIQAPDLYRSAVALAPAEVGPGILSPAVESYIGLAADDPELYRRVRNADKVDRITGELLIITGTDDVNTPIEQTLQLSNALIEAGKLFDQVIMPGLNHALADASGVPRTEFMYGAMLRHFERTLHPGT